MKIISLILCLFLSGTATFAQIRNNLHSRAVFTLNDGSEQPVFFEGYTTPSQSIMQFVRGTDIYKFRYKLEEDAKTLTIDASEVKKVKFLDEFEEERLGWERLNLYAVSDKGEVTEKVYESWQPLLYDGKIKVYGSNVYSCTSYGCQWAHVRMYLRNEKDDFAVMPVDYDRLLISFWKQDEKLVEALRLVGKDCPEFNKYIDFFYDKLKNDKEFRKKFKRDRDYLRQRALKETKARGLRGRERVRFFENYTLDFHLDFYQKVIAEYEKNCQH